MSRDTWQVRSQALKRPPLRRDIWKLEIKFFFFLAQTKNNKDKCETALTKAVALIFAKQQVPNVDGHGVKMHK